MFPINEEEVKKHINSDPTKKNPPEYLFISSIEDSILEPL